jgi:dTMP kinase
VGRLLRSLLAGAAAPVDPAAMALLFAADRRDHLSREILPYLSQGVHVICDRYVLSSLVYQVAAGAPRDLIAAANAGARRPDLTLLLDVSAEVAAARRDQRRLAPDLYETDETQRKVAAAYREEARHSQEIGDKVVVLDGSGTMEEVAEQVLRTLRTCLDLPLQARSKG